MSDNSINYLVSLGLLLFYDYYTNDDYGDTTQNTQTQINFKKFDFQTGNRTRDYFSKRKKES